ncbi:MAG: GNAT family N-acetyltransferase [Desulfobacteraceae bacterium]|nr:GNAT family N-acetyltransferase [Desulfobacteraceae bacterium]
MTDIAIRRANLKELSTLLEIEQRIIEAERPFDNELKTESISYYDLEALVLSAKAEVLVAEINNKIVGSGYAEIRKSKSYMKHSYHSYLGFMYVEPTFRGKGINKLILDSLKEWSKSQQIFHFSLEVYADNQVAIRAYEKAGFKSNLIEMSESFN